MIIPEVFLIPILIITCLIIILFFIFARHSLRKKSTMAHQFKLGDKAYVVSSASQHAYWVRIEGELWLAHCPQPLAPGDETFISHIDYDHLILNVQLFQKA